MPLYHIRHITRYTYTTPVTDSANQIILRLSSDKYQEVAEQKITLSPNAPVDEFSDYFGNTVGMFTIVQPHTELSITATAEVITKEVPVPEDTAAPATQWSFIDQVSNEVAYLDFIKPEIFNTKEAIAAVIAPLANREKTVLQSALALSGYIYETFTYQQGVTSIETGIDEIWKLRAGVCQDFAHLMLEMLRMCGIPARYVSGYICPKGDELRGEGATHAWVEAYIPEYGWLGIDPTNNCLVSDRHIRIAFGRNFNDCTPVKGTYKGSAAHTLSVSVIITNEKMSQEELNIIPEPVYITQVPENAAVPKNNSYQKFLEMQQQQQQ